MVGLWEPIGATEAQPPSNSRILKIYKTDAERDSGQAPAISLSNYTRPDILGSIYRNQFILVPATGLDNIRYFAQSVGDLAERCANLHLDTAKAEILPYIFSGSIDLVGRFQSDRLAPSEMLQAGWMILLNLSAAQSCTYYPGAPGTIDQAQARCNEGSGAKRYPGSFLRSTLLMTSPCSWDVMGVTVPNHVTWPGN